MNTEEFKKILLSRNEHSIDARVNRRAELKTAYYKQLPKLMFDYISVAASMYIDGYFIGTILFCSAIIEITLLHQLTTKSSFTQEELSRFSLDKLVIIAHRQNIVSDEQRKIIDDIRSVRNPLVHADYSKINKMANKHFDETYGIPELYLFPLAERGAIQKEALDAFLFTRELTLQFYGDKEM